MSDKSREAAILAAAIGPDWPAQALAVLQDASGHTTEDTELILQALHERGYALVPIRVIQVEALGALATYWNTVEHARK